MNHKRHNTLSPFYKMYLNMVMERLKELYQREIRGVKTNIIFQNQQKHNVMKAVLKKPPRKITKPKKINQLMSNFTNDQGYNAKADQVVKPKYLKREKHHHGNRQLSEKEEKKKTIVKYAQILRAVVWAQRRFRQRQLEKKMGKFARGDGTYLIPVNVKYM